VRARLVVKAGEFDDEMSQVLLTKDKDVHAWSRARGGSPSTTAFKRVARPRRRS
jgi:hypothetical protein